MLTRAADSIRAGNLAEAESLLRAVMREKPDDPDALHLLGLVAHYLGQYRYAVSLIETALTHRPGDSRMYSNCGEAYRRLGDMDRASQCLRRALEINPRNADAWCNLGSVCRELGRLDEAITAYRRAVSLEDRHANAHYNLGLALLVTGNFPEGWKEYEYRWAAVRHMTPRDYGRPRWTGQNPAQKTILVYHEQGHGDTLQFVRYVTRLIRMGAKVILECPPAFHGLFQCLAGVECRSSVDGAGSFDYQVPLLSLPAVFDTTLNTIPGFVPYLQAPADKAELWRKRVYESACRVGICWAGNPHHINDRNRSCRLTLFSCLSGIDGAVFYSLQKGEAATQAKHPPAGMRIVDFTDELRDWGDTAALIETLDLIVTVDTAVAHLAGALGRPVWMLVPFDPDWRWLLGRSDSPWYPTMRLFRQPARRKWTAVSEALAAAVAEGGFTRDAVCHRRISGSR